jgi:hypothetical protein
MPMPPALNSFNLFDVLALPRQEDPHDRMLTWLLDPSAGHGISSFAAALISELWSVPFSQPVRRVKRQYQLSPESYPDIGVEFETALLVIENKVNAGALREGQLGLQNELAKKKQVGKPLYHLLLHPDRLNVDGIALQETSFRTLSYSELARLIDAAAVRASNEDAKAFLRHYSKHVSERFGKAPPAGVRMASGTKIARRNSIAGWTEEGFISQAATLCDPAVLGKHTDLIDLLRSMDAIDVRFDAVGPTNATYKVYLTGTEIHFLWVFANGGLYVTWKPLRTAGIDGGEEFWKHKWGNSINAGNKNDSFATGGLQTFAVEDIAQKLQAIADFANRVRNR